MIELDRTASDFIGDNKKAKNSVPIGSHWLWQEWYPNEGQKYKGNGNAMLEVYSPGDMKSPDYECGIWVPICKSVGQNEQETAEIVSTMMITGIL